MAGARIARDPGVYVLLLELHEPLCARVGRLGEVRLEPGAVAYTGSAMGGLAARVGRHARRSKPRRWHIDYVTAVARPSAALLVHTAERIECRLGTWLKRAGWRPGPIGFGCSDCRCATHLYVRPEGMDLDALLDATPVRWRGRAEIVRFQPARASGPRSVERADACDASSGERLRRTEHALGGGDG